MRSKGPTLQEMADEAGVGRATLARYLKEPSSVKKQTQQKIAKIMLKHERHLQSPTHFAHKLKVTYFRLSSRSHFLRSLENALLSQCAMMGIIGNVFTLSSHEDTLISQLNKAAEDCDILILSIPHTPKIRHHLEIFIQQGKKIISLISDIPGLSESNFIGIDNIAAGRVAAHMALSYCGKTNPHILILAGDVLLDDHKFRQLGFLQYLEQKNIAHTPHILDSKENLANLEEYLVKKIQSYQNLDIIYSTPMLNALLLNVIKKARLDPKPYIVTHEFTPASKQGLIEGIFDLVIMQDVEEIAQKTIQVIQALNAHFPIENNRITWNKIHLITVENMPQNMHLPFEDHFNKKRAY